MVRIAELPIDGLRQVNKDQQKEILQKLNITEEKVNAIFYTNAKEFVNIPKSNFSGFG